MTIVSRTSISKVKSEEKRFLGYIRHVGLHLIIVNAYFISKSMYRKSDNFGKSSQISRAAFFHF